MPSLRVRGVSKLIFPDAKAGRCVGWSEKKLSFAEKRRPTALARFSYWVVYEQIRPSNHFVQERTARPTPFQRDPRYSAREPRRSRAHEKATRPYFASVILPQEHYDYYQ